MREIKKNPIIQSNYLFIIPKFVVIIANIFEKDVYILS